MVYKIGQALIYSAQVVHFSPRLWKRRETFVNQLINSGLKTFFIISVVALFTGMILSLQTGFSLGAFSQEHRVGQLVILTMSREMGPFMTALILAASIGSSYAAEFASMKNAEEIYALKIMGINFLDFVVMPRFWALMLVIPFLTLYAIVIGYLGGGFVAMNHFNISFELYNDFAFRVFSMKDIYIALIKSVLFAFFIMSISIYKGLNCSNSSAGVSQATRSTVITSFLFILISGFFVTGLMGGK